jgi:hypothetical protein
MFTKSKTDAVDPNLAIDIRETELPSRAKLRRLSELPTCRKSSTETLDPNRAS